jgi:hypothetical protein
MPQLTLERISSRALDRLEELAARQGRTVADVASEILERAPQLNPESRGEAARRIRSMTPSDVSQTDSTGIIRSLRDE